MSKLNSGEDVRLERRPATPDEFPKLLTAAVHGTPFRSLTGPDRAMLYLVAVETGLRASELASLTEASLDLSGEIPTVTLEAAYSKRRRRDVQPIHPELAEGLRTWLASRPRSAPMLSMHRHAPAKLWPGTWNEKAAKMLRVDLDAAGIAFEDERGRLDFHSLRGTFATNLATAGVSPKAAQELMRHSDINLTMKTYTTLRLSDVAGDLNKLPALPTGDGQTQRATGTTDAAPIERHTTTAKPTPVLVARLVARPIGKKGLPLMTADESRPSESAPEAASSTNAKTPVLQGFDVGCEPLRIAEKEEPPLRLELRTYALRKRRSTN